MEEIKKIERDKNENLFGRWLWNARRWISSFGLISCGGRMKDLGDRMKRYENTSRFYLTPRTPVIIRLDGRAFHTLTKLWEKPFDLFFMNTMQIAALKVAEQIQGFKLAYVQSDEASFLITDYDDLSTQGWFNYNLSKIITIAASTMSAHFTQQMSFHPNIAGIVGVFDGRAFNIPEDDVSNYFLWRAKDWYRNSLTMYAQAFFSHKQLLNKSSADKHEMLHSIGMNWAIDLDDRIKNGTWILGNKLLNHAAGPSYDVIDKLWR